MLWHAVACFYLHMWVPTLLWQIELTCKRRHAQHWWAELITFTIRIVCSGIVDIHHSQMAQSVVAHMQTVLCLDVAHQTERSLNMASRAWSSDKENSKADRHMNAKKWMLRHAAACFKTPMCSSKTRVLRHAAACCGCTCLPGGGGGLSCACAVLGVPGDGGPGPGKRGGGGGGRDGGGCLAPPFPLPRALWSLRRHAKGIVVTHDT